MRGHVLLALLAVTAGGGCYRERDRFDVPQVTLLPADTMVAARDTIRGVLRASDRSGIVTIRLFAIGPLGAPGQPRDTVRQRFDVGERRDVEVQFALPLQPSMRAGTRVELEATVFDTQDFRTVTRDTVVVQEP